MTRGGRSAVTDKHLDHSLFRGRWRIRQAISSGLVTGTRRLEWRFGLIAR